VLRFRHQVQQQLGHGVTAVGQNLHPLIHLQALRLQDLEKPPLRTGIDVGHEREARRIPVFAPDLAGDHLERPLRPGVGIPGMHIAVIQADGQACIGAGEQVLVALVAFDEVRLLRGQLALEPFGHVADLAADRGRVQSTTNPPPLAVRLGSNPTKVQKPS
jgi:hypothetical protein